jgi:hypothetical protein
MRRGTVGGGGAVSARGAMRASMRMPGPAVPQGAARYTWLCAPMTAAACVTGAAAAHCAAHGEPSAGEGLASWQGEACDIALALITQPTAKDACTSRKAASTSLAALRKPVPVCMAGILTRYSLTRLRRSALLTTDTELIAIAAPANMGESSTAKNG